MRTLFVVRVTAKLSAWQGDWDAEQCLADREKYQSRSVELYEGEDWNEAIATLARAESAEARAAALLTENEELWEALQKSADQMLVMGWAVQENPRCRLVYELTKSAAQPPTGARPKGDSDAKV